jgi:DNA-binding transcriptional regulator YiaG
MQIYSRSTKKVGIAEKCCYTHCMLMPEHCRAVRAWFNWTQQEFAEKAGVSLSTVRDFEKGERTPIRNNMSAMTRVIENHGVKLLDDGGRPAGIAVVSPDRTSVTELARSETTPQSADHG